METLNKYIRVVQFKMAYMCSGKPISAPPRLSEVSPTLVLLRKIVLRLLFQRLSPPGDQWCDVLGFVPGDSVSSFSTLQIFREASHLLATRQFICLVISLHSGMYRAAHPQEFSKVDVNHRYSPVWASH